MSYNLSDIKLREGYTEPGDPLLWPYLPPPLKEVFDALYGSDSVTVNKTIVIEDSASAVDSVAKDWMPIILDALFSSDLPYVHKQVLVTDILTAISESPSTPEKTKFVTDFLTALESFHDVWKGKWDEPIQELYQSLRDLKLKLVTEKDMTLKAKEK